MIQIKIRPHFCQQFSSIEHLVRKLIEKIKPTFKHVIEIWSEIGLEGDRKGQRIDEIIGIIHERVANIEEIEWKNLEDLKDYKILKLTEINQICKDLSMADFVIPNELSLLSVTDWLKKQYEQLMKIKDERMGRFQELLNSKENLCKILKMEKPFHMMTAIPSEAELVTLKGQINELSAIYTQRKKTFSSFKKMVVDYFSDLEREVKSDFEKLIIFGEEKDFILSSENISNIQLLNRELAAEYEINKNLRDSLMTRLLDLMLKLDVDDEIQKRTLAPFKIDCKPSTLKVLEAELQKYQELRKLNLDKFITKLKTEVIGLYEECYQVCNEGILESEEISEEVLDQLEEVEKKMKSFKEKNKSIIEGLAKWNKAWKDLLELEKNMCDPSRFNNRKYNLLNEEKNRKKLHKELPLTEKNLKILSKSYVNENGQYFLVLGVPLETYLQNVWDNYENEKEQEKLQRQKIKQKKLAGDTRGRKVPPGNMLTRRSPVKRNTPNIPIIHPVLPPSPEPCSSGKMRKLEKRTPLSPIRMTSNLPVRNGSTRTIETNINQPIIPTKRRNLDDQLKAVANSNENLSETDFQVI